MQNSADPQCTVRDLNDPHQMHGLIIEAQGEMAEAQSFLFDLIDPKRDILQYVNPELETTACSEMCSSNLET